MVLINIVIVIIIDAYELILFILIILLLKSCIRLGNVMNPIICHGTKIIVILVMIVNT